MLKFVNREEEMQFIRDNCSTLLDQRLITQLPIIQFNGVGGIGKTRILREVEDYCNSNGLHSIWADANLNTEELSHRVVSQVKKYGVRVPLQSDDWSTLSIHATRTLITEKGPAVFLIDSLENARDPEIAWVENLLATFLNENKLFFLLASQREMTFERVKEVSRRVNTIRLKPFSADICKRYLSSRARNLDQEVQDLIYEWTGGYPLAINSMLEAIEQKRLDPRRKKDQRALLTHIRRQVISQSMFSQGKQPAGRIEWFEGMFSLFAVPRRCVDVTFMQDLIERFEPQYRLDTGLAYVALPSRINDRADVFGWNKAKAGFTLDTTIRHIFLKNLEIDQPERYKLIHRHLADVNRQLATKATGSERIRFLLEYLYHSACCEEGPALRQIVETSVQQVINEPRDDFGVFREEYLGDTELQEILGEHHNTALSLISRHLAGIYRQLALQSSDLEGPHYFVAWLKCMLEDPYEDLPASPRVKEWVQGITKRSPEVREQVKNELLRDASVQEKLRLYPNLLSPFLP
jgi:hypothetical protein